MEIELDTFVNITNNLDIDDGVSLLEQFVDNYPDVFTNITDKLEPIHLYHLCMASKKRLNKLCEKYEKIYNIINHGIQQFSTGYNHVNVISLNIKNKVYFVFSEPVVYDLIEREKNIPIKLDIPIVVFSCCITGKYLYILDVYGKLYKIKYKLYDNDNLYIFTYNEPIEIKINNILSITSTGGDLIINTLDGVYINEKSIDMHF